MGTNYYRNDLGDAEDRDSVYDPEIHIGKRSAAGLYCFDCGITLCSEGSRSIHSSHSSFLTACPSCKKQREDETIVESTAGMELWPSKEKDIQKRSGVKSCSSFTWTKMKHYWDLKTLALNGDERAIVSNEYGDKYTAKEFLLLVEACPMWSQDYSYFS